MTTYSFSRVWEDFQETFSDRTEEFYEDPERAAFNDIQRLIVEDWVTLEKDGFYSGSELVWPIVLGIKGDWSYLVPCLHCCSYFFLEYLGIIFIWTNYQQVVYTSQINSFMGFLPSVLIR